MGMRKSLFFPIVLCTLLVLSKFGKSDINQDKQECASQLVAIATCLPYVSGHAKSPTPDCCTGVKQTIQESQKCICLLIKDRDDPSLGLKINVTLALSLPDRCHTPNHIGQCPGLLHLAPNDPDTKLFNDFAKQAAAAPSVATSSPASPSTTGVSSAKDTSDGGNGKRGLRTFYGLVLVWCSYFTIKFT